METFKIWLIIAGFIFIVGCFVGIKLEQRPNEEYLKFKDRRKGIGAVTAILIAICFMIGCNSCWNEVTDGTKNNVKPKKSDTSSVQSQLPTVTPVEVPKPDSSDWVYADEDNKMTGGKDRYAEVESPTILNFNFPYDGGSQTRLFVRNIEGFNKVYLLIDKGQFIMGEVRIRYDNGKAHSYQGRLSLDGNMTELFIEPANAVILKLKKSKNIVLEAPFYQAGEQDMDFHVEGLKWKY